MPYKDPEQRRKTVRESVARLRQRHRLVSLTDPITSRRLRQHEERVALAAETEALFEEAA